MRARTLAGGTNTVISIVLLIGVLGAANYLASRHYWRTDLTANQAFTLSEQTKRVLTHLDRDVKILSFFRAGDPAANRMKDLVTMYDDLSPRLSYEVIDPDRQPGRASQYPGLEYGITVVDAGDRTERLDRPEEEPLTNAIIQATRDDKKTIAFLTGHGERDPLATDDEGYSNLRARLVREGYEITIPNLAAETAVPEEVRVLVIAGARKELLPNEEAAVAAFLAAGGSLFVLADPAPNAGHAALLRPYGIEMGNDLILDVSGVGRLFGADEFLPMGLQYKNHPLSAGFDLTTVYPHARSVQAAAEVPAGATVTEIVMTAPASWAESAPGTRPYELGADDRQGPICVLAAGSRPVGGGAAATPGDSAAAAERTTRIVAAGDSDFCANGFSQFGGNLDLALNAVSWLAEEEDLIAIRPKDREDRRVNLTQGQAMTVRSVLLLIMPLAVVGAGIGVWWRRR